MSIDEFVADMHEQLERFANYWHEQQAADGVFMWPRGMTEGEWADQFDAWLSGTAQGKAEIVDIEQAAEGGK